MKSVFVALHCLLAVASAQWDWQQPGQDIVYEHMPDGRVICRINCHQPLRQCPQVTCPTLPSFPTLPSRPALNPQCPIRVCTDQNSHLLFPTPNPNTFYQCIKRPGDRGTWDGIEMNCGCQTQFDYDLQICVHPFEYRRQCISTPVPVPPPRACVAPPTQQPGWPPVQQPIWPPVQQPIHPPIPPVQTPDSNPPWLPPQFPPQQPINPPWPPSQPPNQIPDSNPPWLPPQFPPQPWPPAQPPSQNPEANPPWFPPQFPPGQNPVTNPPLVTEPATPCTCAPCVWWPCPPCDCEA